ncbi:hypothetical protein SAMN03097699_2624 [Flavobacteriaceae bacterium MAR_2010_188]|nr:hypothetical protein SAMN03097699_2624 [Flavobacteriaceae bacterium MAR_2010_188]
MKINNFFWVFAAMFMVTNFASSQNYDEKYKSKIVPSYWQQHVVYDMDIDMDVETFRYTGVQKLEYTNNSPDTLTSVFYHLYANAFQPESEMNARLTTIKDPDGRMVNNLGSKDEPNYESRISKLNDDEIGFIKVNSLNQDGTDLTYSTVGTVLEVKLNTPILPGEKSTFNMKFDAQVPLQIRRSGRNNSEGVALSMAQWYPKLAEYDEEGWHADPYISREFYGVWGDFNVNITIDKDYVLGGTGYLQNPNEIGHGYQDEAIKVDIKNKEKLTWKFFAPNVHDFTWAADPDYVHDVSKIENGPTIHFLYKNNPEIKENWINLQPKASEILKYFSETIGKYPYKQYSVIQAGDGGMEYGMCTFITGNRSFESLVGVTAHEMGHSWFQFLLGTNELKYGWMDEGYTSYFSNMANEKVLNKTSDNPSAGLYRGYLRLAKSGLEEPLSTHSDHFDINGAYSVYTKGGVFLSQLKYIIGEDNFDKTIKDYFNNWAFKHPDANDFIRIAEKTSGMNLHWYLSDWLNTTNTIDFGVKNIEGNKVEIERLGKTPMPIDLNVEYTDGTSEQFNIPLRDMRGNKPTESTILEDWAWAYPTYSFEAKKPIKCVTIDPNNLMADINPENNTFTAK